MDDKKLYKDFLKGDNYAFDKLMKKYRDDVINFLETFVKNRDVAEDLSQDVFVYMIVNRKEYDFKYSIRTYMYTIARSRAINYINKSKKEISIDDESLDIDNMVDDFRTEDEIINEENKKEIEKALVHMKEEYRTIIKLKYYDDFSYKEICKIMNKTMPQVKVLLHRAKEMLKRNLNKEEYKC